MKLRLMAKLEEMEAEIKALRAERTGTGGASLETATEGVRDRTD